MENGDDFVLFDQFSRGSFRWFRGSSDWPDHSVSLSSVLSSLFKELPVFLIYFRVISLSSEDLCNIF